MAYDLVIRDGTVVDSYDATVANGRVFMRAGEPTGELAGTVLRSGPPSG